MSVGGVIVLEYVQELQVWIYVWDFGVVNLMSWKFNHKHVVTVLTVQDVDQTFYVMVVYVVHQHGYVTILKTCQCDDVIIDNV